MHYFPSLEKINLQSIAFSNEGNLHPFLSPDPPERLCSSIHSIGILHPPILKVIAPDQYQVLCGRYRLRALKRYATQQTSISALVLNEQTSPEKILRYILEDQFLTGTLSPMEKAYFFSYSLPLIGIDLTRELFISIYGDKIQNHLITNSLLLLKLESELQHNIHFGKINEKLAFELLRLNSADRLTLHNLVQELELGGGKQKRLLSLSKELEFQHGKTITSLLLEEDFVNVLEHPEMNRPQKTATLLSILQNKLFPQSSSAEEHYRKCVNRMKLPASCSISHSQAFERDEITVSLCFQSLTEVENRLPEIIKIAETKK
jgi:hypothetical protein